MRYLIKFRQYFGLKNEEINRLLNTIKTKAIVSKRTMVGSVVTTFLVITIGMGFMFYKNPPSKAYALYAASHLIIANIVTTMVLVHLFNLYLAYIIMADCLTARIKSVTNQLQIHRTDKKDYSNLWIEVESIFETLKDYNKAVKFILRNVIYLFRTGLCALLVMMSLDMDVYVKALITFPSLSGVCIIIMTGRFRNEEYALLTVQLNTCYVRFIEDTEYSLRLKLKTRLLIKELGNDDKDGHLFSDSQMETGLRSPKWRSQTSFLKQLLTL